MIPRLFFIICRACLLGLQTVVPHAWRPGFNRKSHAISKGHGISCIAPFSLPDRGGRRFAVAAAAGHGAHSRTRAEMLSHRLTGFALGFCF